MSPPMMSLLPESRALFVSRVLTALMLLGAFLCAFTGYTGPARSCVAFAVMTFVLYGLRTLMGRWAHALRFTTHVLAGSLLLLSVGLAYVNGAGLYAPILFALPTVPLFVAFLQGWKPAAAWTGVAVLVPVILYMFEFRIEDIPIPPSTFGALQVVAMVSSVVTVLTVAGSPWSKPASKPRMRVGQSQPSWLRSPMRFARRWAASWASRSCWSTPTCRPSRPRRCT